MVWEQSKLPFPNLQLAPAWAGRTLLPVFPLPLVWDLVPRGHIWDRSCAGAELSQLPAWFPQGRARRSARVPQLWLQQLLLPSQGKERGSGPLPARAGLWLCCSPPVAADSSAFTVRHLSLLQQTLPFLGSKGFLELPFPKLGSTCHGKSSMENALPALLGSLPCRGGPLLVPAPRRGWVDVWPCPPLQPSWAQQGCPCRGSGRACGDVWDSQWGRTYCIPEES